MTTPNPSTIESLADVDEPSVVKGERADEGTTEAQPLSKNAKKRLEKEARRAAQKVEWKAKEKALKKEKQRIKAEKRAAGLLDPDEGRPVKRQKVVKKTPFDARIVVDLGFDDKMNSKEVKSLCSQLNFTYASNKKAVSPFTSLLFTSLNGRTKDGLDAIGNAAYQRWRGVDFWQESYECLWSGEDPRAVAEDQESTVAKSQEPAEDQNGAGPSSQTRRDDYQHSTDKSKVVYLTADSETEIAGLLEGETYVIGGIVDRNRYKSLCLSKAQDQGLRTARLPIGTYLANLPTRKVLTVNQVFDILLKWVEERDWEAALMAVMPKRKFKEPNGPKASEDAEDALEEGISNEDAKDEDKHEEEKMDDNGIEAMVDETSVAEEIHAQPIGP